MLIKLICPKMKLRPLDSQFKTNVTPAIGLLVLAALTPARHRVQIVDENVEPLSFDDTPDLVGITVTIDSAPRSYEIARAYRARNIPVIAGGIHASSCPDEALQFVNSVCIGEAEELWPRILCDLEAGMLQSRYFNPRPTPAASLVMPDWERINRDNYIFTNVICASRGCPHQCEFCYNSCGYQHHAYRARPVADIVREIDRLGSSHIIFADDNLIGNERWARELMAALRPLNVKWNAAVSVLIGRNIKLLDAMKEAGCQSLFIGFETIKRTALSAVRKFQNCTSEYDQVVSEIHDRGIMINASFVFGFDQDTSDVFEYTLDWVTRNRIETLSSHILTPYPGTLLHQRMMREGRIVDFNHEHYDTAHVVFRPARMTARELAGGYHWISQRFYSADCIAVRLPLDRSQWLPFLAYTVGYVRFGRNVPRKLIPLATARRFGRLASTISYGVSRRIQGMTVEEGFRKAA